MGVGRGRRVLLAEDDQVQREILQEVLEYEGYEVVAAADPKSVIRALAHRPDLVLLDVGGVTTPDVAAAIRRSGAAVLVVSGDHRLVHVAALIGADGHIAKPYDLSELLERIDHAIDNRAARELATA